MSDTPINLSEEHIKQIQELHLDIHLTNAISSIDGLVNSANREQRLTLDAAVAQYCKNMLNAYKNWLDQVDAYATQHSMTRYSAISVLEDQGAIRYKDLFWPSGFHTSALSKAKASYGS